jgi:hypothetical protein
MRKLSVAIAELVALGVNKDVAKEITKNKQARQEELVLLERDIAKVNKVLKRWKGNLAWLRFHKMLVGTQKVLKGLDGGGLVKSKCSRVGCTVVLMKRSKGWISYCSKKCRALAEGNRLTYAPVKPLLRLFVRGDGVEVCDRCLGVLGFSTVVFAGKKIVRTIDGRRWSAVSGCFVDEKGRVFPFPSIRLGAK